MRWTVVDETNEIDCGLQQIKWNMKNEVNNVTFPSLSLMILG